LAVATLNRHARTHSPSTCIMGALPVGTASDGATYSLPLSWEYPIKPAIPMSTNAQTSRSILITALLSRVRESLQSAFRVQSAFQFHWLLLEAFSCLSSEGRSSKRPYFFAEAPEARLRALSVESK
jgi:hypothetical protein